MAGAVRPSFRALRATAFGLFLAALPVAIAPAFSDQSGYLRISGASAGHTQQVSLQLNKSIILDLPADAGEVVISQPSVANAIMRSKRRAILQGTGSGDTNIIFLDAAGHSIAVLDIKVIGEPSQVGSALEGALARILPGSAIRVESVTLGDDTNRVVLTGSVRSQDDLQRAVAVAIQFAGSADNVASVLKVAGPQQVMLKVTVAEVSREVAKQFGINLSGSVNIGGLTTSLVSNQPLGGASGLSTNNGISIGGNIGGVSLQASLKALEERDAIRTLAEPTLTAMSGQPAEFLAGGQFPVETRGDNGAVTTIYKDYGAKLNFTPTVKSDGIIGLLVDTSVSEPTGNGALQERRAKTTVELRSGQTLAIGGLIQDRLRHQINQFPGLANIPILGALFRSRDYIRDQTELVILVTPYLAYPADQAPTLPTDTMTFAGDAEAIFLGHIEKLYGVGSPADMRGGYDGSVGFVLD